MVEHWFAEKRQLRPYLHAMLKGFPSSCKSASVCLKHHHPENLDSTKDRTTYCCGCCNNIRAGPDASPSQNWKWTPVLANVMIDRWLPVCIPPQSRRDSRSGNLLNRVPRHNHSCRSSCKTRCISRCQTRCNRTPSRWDRTCCWRCNRRSLNDAC